MHNRANRSQDSGCAGREDEEWCPIIMSAVYTRDIVQNNTTVFRSSTIFFDGGGQTGSTLPTSAGPDAVPRVHSMVQSCQYAPCEQHIPTSRNSCFTTERRSDRALVAIEFPHHDPIVVARRPTAECLKRTTVAP